MHKFSRLAVLAIACLLLLASRVGATLVPCGDQCVINPAVAPNVILPGGQPGFELSAVRLVDHAAGPNVLIGLFPPGPPCAPQNPATQSLVLGGPAAGRGDS